jgi:hypothetical protein
MVTHMKTTVDIADSLLDAAKVRAAKENRTLRDLIEEGLRHVLESRPTAKPFTLRDASFGSKGLREGVVSGDWDRVLAEVYEGRGG